MRSFAAKTLALALKMKLSGRPSDDALEVRDLLHVEAVIDGIELFLRPLDRLFHLGFVDLRLTQGAVSQNNHLGLSDFSETRSDRKPDDLPFGSFRAPGAIVDFKKNWNKLRAAIGRPDLRLHDLRHHRAKLLLQSGATLAVASQVLGNSSLVLYRRYGHLESGAISNAVRKSWK